MWFSVIDWGLACFLSSACSTANLILAKECVGFGKCLPINKERPLQKNVLITNYTGKGAEQANESWKASGDDGVLLPLTGKRNQTLQSVKPLRVMMIWQAGEMCNISLKGHTSETGTENISTPL